MIKKQICLALLVVISSPAFANLPTDDDWQGFKVGMSASQVENLALKHNFKKVSRIRYKDAYVDYKLPSYDMAGVKFSVNLQMSDGEDRLEQVLFEHSQKPSATSKMLASCGKIKSFLAKQYGKPTDTNQIGPSLDMGGMYLDVADWSLGKATVSVVCDFTPKISDSILIRYWAPKEPDGLLSLHLPPKPKEIYSRDEFVLLLTRKTMSEVISIVGRPASTNNAGEVNYWYYHRKTFDPIASKVDDIAQIVFEDEKVKSINFSN